MCPVCLSVPGIEQKSRVTSALGSSCFSFLQMRPYFPTEVEGKDVSSKLMVMVGVYMCYKVLICRIQVIKQTYVT